MMGASHQDRVRRSVLFGLFFLSGAAALVYQTAWHRLLGLFAGADTIAAALVVGAFLLGLGIGSLVAGLLADRLSRRAALLAFALCEVGIAAFAVLSPWLYYGSSIASCCRSHPPAASSSPWCSRACCGRPS
jgi:spermidine synthase